MDRNNLEEIIQPYRLPLPRETERLILRTPLPTDSIAIQEALEESFTDLIFTRKITNDQKPCPITFHTTILQTKHRKHESAELPRL